MNRRLRLRLRLQVLLLLHLRLLHLQPLLHLRLLLLRLHLRLLLMKLHLRWLLQLLLKMLLRPWPWRGCRSQSKIAGRTALALHHPCGNGGRHRRRNEPGRDRRLHGCHQCRCRPGALVVQGAPARLMHIGHGARVEAWRRGHMRRGCPLRRHGSVREAPCHVPLPLPLLPNRRRVLPAWRKRPTGGGAVVGRAPCGARPATSPARCDGNSWDGLDLPRCLVPG
mmetsp:Transcript_16668/g.35306  ORF Transcript_16668/g.35306 Transcript_16668/m.35306 type:complete len:224 (+) Transcript_16668:737-1408(+)